MFPIPIHRDLRFKLDPTRICDWHPGDHKIAHFFSALSLFFPEGERFFIQSVRHYRERVTDPELQRAVTAFIGQEAMHGREHDEYNRAMRSAGLPQASLERTVVAIVDLLRKLPPASQLAVTVALEHFTAMMADALLRDQTLIEGAEPHYRALWNWHALEETEHKAVAYDVFVRALGTGPRAYVLRTSALIGVTLLYWPLVFAFHLRLIAADPKARRLRGWGELVAFLWGPRKGVFPKLLRPWLDWFRPDFHPWDHDNRAFLEQMQALLAPVEVAPLPRAA